MEEYNPTTKQVETRKRVYDAFLFMKKQRDGKYKYFNNRTLKEFIDDSELRATSYVPTREEQGKESWQANFFHPTTRNKLKAILAAVALDIPQTRIMAQNEKSQRDQTRANVMRDLVRFSYDQENKEENVFFEAWENSVKGTVITYDGYLKSSAKRKVITSFDPETGDVEYEEEEVEVDNQCMEFIVPLENMYIRDFYIRDIQDQPDLCWVERVNKETFDNEFSKYKNHKFVKTAGQLTQEEEERFMKNQWESRTSDYEPYEVIRYFHKQKDEFVIVANGIILFESPLILGKKKKWYPFAKSIFEPFAQDFFYGNSLPNSLMGEQDVINSLYNMALDKTYKSMMANLIVGGVNKDDFDLEDGTITHDTITYVEDIQQVKEMPINGISQSDMNMIEMVSRGLDLSSVDANQQGIANRGVTAREVVIANENAKKLKGILYLFLTSLWVQKMRLRILNILTYYTQPKAEKVLGDNQEETIIDSYRKFMVDNTELSNGQKGTLGIQMVGSPEELPSEEELDINEEAYTMQNGGNYEEIAITSDYLNDWIYDVKVVSESVFQREGSLTQAKMEDKLKMMDAFFPEQMIANKEKMFKDAVTAFDDDPDDYELTPPMPAMPQGLPGEAPVPVGAEQATAGQTGLPPL